MSESEKDRSEDDQPLFASAGMAASGLFKAFRRKAEPKAEAAPIETEVAPAEASEPELASIQTDPPEAAEPEAEAPPAEVEKPAPEPEYTGKRIAIFTDATADFELEKGFQRLEGTRIDAVQAEDEELANAAQVRSGARKLYTKPKKLFKSEEIHISVVSCGSVETRSKAIKLALTNGSHALAAVPIAPNLKEASELVKQAEEANRLILPILPLRHHPDVQAFREHYKSLIGEIVEISIEGEQGPQSGGEDLLLHGVHGLDLVRWFGGEPEFCDGQITDEGERPLPDDARPGGTDGSLGPVVGDCIRAQFTMSSGITASFRSDRRLSATSTGPSALITGTKAKMLIRWSEDEVKLFLLRPAKASDGFLEKANPWPPTKENAQLKETPRALVIGDFLDLTDQEEIPTFLADNAVKALEMAHGIWQAGTSTKRAFFPLANRLHPLQITAPEPETQTKESDTPQSPEA